MLEYGRIDISEGIDINKLNDKSKKCNGCQDLMQKAMNFNYVAIVSVKGNDYRVHFWYMSKDDAISIMHNSSLIDKKDTSSFFYI